MANPKAEPAQCFRCAGDSGHAMMRAMMMRLLVPALFLLFAGPALAAEPLDLKLRYRVYAGGLRAAEANVTIARSGDDYSIVTEAKTSGLLAMVTNWTTRVESHGRVGSDGALHPLWHQSVTNDRGSTKRMRLDFPPDGPIATLLDPAPTDPLPEAERIPVEALAGAADGLTVILSTLFADAGGCTGRHAVYDGKRRFDLTMVAGGADSVPKSSYNLFTGTAEICRLGFVPVAGFSDKTRRNQFWSRYGDAGGAKTLPVWLARFEGVPVLLPVRMRMETKIGIVMAHLDRIERSDSGLLLQQ